MNPPPKTQNFHRFPTISLIVPHFLTLSLLATAISAAAPPLPPSSASIYDQLRHHGLPTGLLPNGITNFSLDPASGQFQAYLPQPCNAKFETQVHYDLNITGTLGLGRIQGLSGMTAQELFLWFPVKGIRVDIPSSGIIHFDVGVVDKQFSLSLFESAPDCTAVDPGDSSFGGGDDPQSGSQNQNVKLEHEVGRGDVLRAVS